MSKKLTPSPKRLKLDGGDLFGLLTMPAVSATYDTTAGKVVTVSGSPIQPTAVVVSKIMAFNLPAWLDVGHRRLFPTRYEIQTTGRTIYHSRFPPTYGIQVNRGAGAWFNERTKVVQARISPPSLTANSGVRRLRAQARVMGGTAAAWAARLQGSGQLVIPEGLPVTWHWCHLVAASLWSVRKAQSRSNLLLGTAAANGQMACMERALKWYVRQFSATVSVEVTCTYLADTPLGLRLRYELVDRHTQGVYREYFELFGSNQAATVEANELAARIEHHLRRDTGRALYKALWARRAHI